MARPRGLRLSRKALDDVLVLKRLTMTEAASMCDLGLTTLSNLATSTRGASMTTVRALSEGLNVSAETLFPELAGFELRTQEHAA